MLQTKTIRSYGNILNEVADDMIQRMRLIHNDKYMLEGKFDVEMNLWALEFIGVVALGGHLNYLGLNLPDSPSRKLIQTVHDILKSADELDFKSVFWRYISTPALKKNYEALHRKHNMYVLFFHQTLSKMEEHFPRSKEFIPEKWAAEKSDPLYYGNAHPFAFRPFGFWARSFIGRQIAELGMETFLAIVIENFHVEWFGSRLRFNQSL